MDDALKSYLLSFLSSLYTSSPSPLYSPSLSPSLSSLLPSPALPSSLLLPPFKGIVHGDFRIDNIIFHPTKVGIKIQLYFFTLSPSLPLPLSPSLCPPLSLTPSPLTSLVSWLCWTGSSVLLVIHFLTWHILLPSPLLILEASFLLAIQVTTLYRFHL